MKRGEVRRGGEVCLSPSALISCVSITSTVSRSVMYPNMATATYQQTPHGLHHSKNAILC